MTCPGGCSDCLFQRLACALFPGFSVCARESIVKFFWLFYQMKDKVRNKLSKRQHEDEASWSTRSWLSLQAQRMSVALQLAAAEEIATELRLAAASEDAAVA